jgi:hypothetical protein
VASLLTPRLVRRYGTGRVAAFGLVVVAGGAALRTTASVHSGVDLQLICLLIFGVGIGCTIAPSTGAIMSSLSVAQAGVGSAINDAARQIGAATGVAVLGSVWASSYHRSLARASIASRVSPQVLASSQRSIGAALQQAGTLPGRAHQQLTVAAKTAFVHGVNVANLVAFAVVLVAAGLALWLLPHTTRPLEVTARREAEAALDEALAS